MATAPLTLTVLRQGAILTMDLMDVHPLVPRCQVPVDEGLLMDLGTEWTRIATVATTQAALGISGATSQRDLRHFGALLFAHLFPAAIQERLRSPTAPHLFLRLDDHLVQLPWELAFDGEDFLLAKFHIGRQVMTDYRPHIAPPALLKDPQRLRMLIIADPTESLPAAAQEVDQLCALLDTYAQLDVDVIGGKHLRKLDLLRALQEHDLVHYAGHASFDVTDPTRSGWMLANGVVTALELSQVAHPPLLVFANACQAGTTTPWSVDAASAAQACGLGSAFLLAGVLNYIGPSCVIPDAHSAAFAADCYRHLLQGSSLGEALAAARVIARQEAETCGLLWASYVHYGNPTFRLPLGSSDEPSAHLAAGQQGRAEATPLHISSAMASHQDVVLSPDALPSSRAERRHLTVLFCDLVNSTALAGQLDPEDYREVVQAYQMVCAQVIARFDGYIAQYRGEGLLVYFGYPRAHDDDAPRAVRAGLGMVEAVGQLTTRLERERGVHLAIRLGIHTGLVVVGAMGEGARQAHLALGETPNLAARLQELAAPNTVMISAATWQLCGGFFTYQVIGPQRLPGRTRPLEVYQVLAETTARGRLDAVRSTGLTPLVGREQEIGLLRERWAQVQDGVGQVVLVNGEAGIGKSRLVEVLQEQVATASQVLLMACHCSAYHQHSAWYPVTDLLERVVLRFDREALPQHKLHRLEAYVGQYGLPLAETVPLLASLLSIPLTIDYPPLSGTPEQQKQKVLHALLTTFVRTAAQQPVLFVMEDLHWADPTTVEFLSLLVDQGPTAPLLALWTFRPDFIPPWTGRAHLTQVTLSRLPRHQTGEMIHQMVHGKALPSEVVEQIVAKTDGVPLFVEELTKMVLESNLLQERDDHYVLPEPLPPLAIPTTLHDALMARLDRLAAVKALAQLGATLGRTFAYELVRVVAPLEEAALQQGLRQLVEADILYQRGVPPQATYQFKHALIQEVAYQSLLKSTRQQYHQRIAQVLEAQFVETVETQPEVLAQHYTEAGLGAQAIPYWDAAGQRALQRSAHLEAISHFTSGIALLQTLPATPAHRQHALMMHIALGAALQITKGLAAPEVEHTYARAYALCQHVEETPQLAPVLFGLWRFHIGRSHLYMTREIGEMLQRLAQRAHDPTLTVIAHYTLGFTWLCLGVFSVARQHFEAGIDLYTPDQSHVSTVSIGHDLGVGCRAYAAMTLWLLGYPDQAVARLHEALALADTLSHPFSLAWAQSIGTFVTQFRRDVLAAHAHAEAVIALSIKLDVHFVNPVPVDLSDING